jgi:hypothetical protein
VTGGEAPFFEEVLDRPLKFQQSDGVSDRGSVFAGALGYLLLGEDEFVHQALKGAGLFDGIQILALEILDQGHLERHLVAHVANDSRNARNRSALGSAPAALARNQLEASTRTADNDGLNDTSSPNRASEFVERLLAEAGPRLIGAGIDQVDINLE